MADREFEQYRREKDEERAAKAHPARAGKDPERERGRTRLDPKRDTEARSDRCEPTDAFGQSRRGHVDQVQTSRGDTSTK